VATGIDPISTRQTADEPGPAAAKPNPFADKEVFLQLLVAQIKNQNPLNPADGVEFLSQLAQFTQLEQIMGIRSGVEAIEQTLRGETQDTADNSGTSA
jgi:flagellar basal-body rod modification protein FlgD